MDFLELLKAVFFGIVEGITEWLPISSTGHLILVEEFIKLDVTKDFLEMFRVVIQFGAILAVIVLYFKKLWPFSAKEKNFIKKDTFSLWFKIVVACIPAAAIGIPFNDKIDELFYNPATVSITLVLYGILFLIIENRHLDKTAKLKDLSNMTYKMAFLIGIFQLLSLIPGTSRSGTTIIGAMLLGSSRFVAAEFTFFLAIPTMFGASLIKIIGFGRSFTTPEICLLLTGIITSFLVSIAVIRFLMGYIKKHDFRVFGWYRIVLGTLVAAYFLIVG